MFDTNKEFNDFWGEPISVYTDGDAIADGTLISTEVYGVQFNGRRVNRITTGAAQIVGVALYEDVVVKCHLEYIARNSEKDREGADAWGIFQPDRKMGDVKLWLVCNEIDGYTLMLPSEY